jgi:hypothetical protein
MSSVNQARGEGGLAPSRAALRTVACIPLTQLHFNFELQACGFRNNAPVRPTYLNIQAVPFAQEALGSFKSVRAEGSLMALHLFPTSGLARFKDGIADVLGGEGIAEGGASRFLFGDTLE